MTVPIRIQRSRAKGWRMPEGVACVSRPGPWGNPFVVGVNGTAAYCVRLYEYMLGGALAVLPSGSPSLDTQMLVRDYVVDNWKDLRGKSLACWCRLDKPCHADVLLRVANAPLTCEAV